MGEGGLPEDLFRRGFNEDVRRPADVALTGRSIPEASRCAVALGHPRRVLVLERLYELKLNARVHAVGALLAGRRPKVAIEPVQAPVNARLRDGAGQPVA